jgi:hypothetical protein
VFDEQTPLEIAKISFVLLRTSLLNINKNRRKTMSMIDFGQESADKQHFVGIKW